MSKLILLNEDVLSADAEKIQSEDEGVEIYLCADHDHELETRAPSPTWSDEDRLRIFHVLVTMASSCMGTTAFEQSHCPVCLFSKFDFFGNLISALEERRDRPKIISSRAH